MNDKKEGLVDYEFVIIARYGNTTHVFSAHSKACCIPTGCTIFRAYVPEWWGRGTRKYQSFLTALAMVYSKKKILAIKLLRSVAPDTMNLKEAKDFVDDLFYPMEEK